jgi:thioredoxin 1
MNKYWIGALALTFAVASLLPAYAQDNPFTALRVAMETATTQGDTQTARQQAHKILEAAQGQAADKLRAEDQYAIGLAHAQVAAELLEVAVQSTELTEWQAGTAKRLLAQLAPAQPALVVVAKGEKINLEDHLVAGKTTIVDFYSEYCGPCRELAPHLEKLVQTRSDIAVVKVDINRPGHQGIDWESPVARQFKLSGIPHLRLYGPDKQLQSEGDPALTQVLGWCGLR